VRLLDASLAGWLGDGGVTVSGKAAEPGSLRVAYALTPQRVGRVRARQPADDAPPRVAVTPALARLAGGVGRDLPLRIDGDPVNVRVAAVVDRIPGTTGDAVLADLGAITNAVDTVAPGGAGVSELWLEVAPGAQSRVDASLSRRPFAVLEKQSRAALEADARRDPLGHGTLLALAASALAALVLAASGLVLAIRADLRDDRGELTDLEAQGATPGVLRRVVAARAALVGVVGAGVGAARRHRARVFVTRVVFRHRQGGRARAAPATTVDPLTLALGTAAFAVAAVALVDVDDPPGFADPRGPGRIGGEGMSALVDLRDVFVVHPSEDGGVAALRGLDVGVERGEICVVLGPSGAGKSTLVRVVARPRASVGGLALVDGPRCRRRLGVRRRTPPCASRRLRRPALLAALSGDLTAQELVGLPLGLRGAARTDRDRRARELLERVGLLDRATGPTGGALRRRAAAHRALRRGRALPRAARRRRADRRARRDDRRRRARSPSPTSHATRAPPRSS
jgi:ABC-type lipoprotein export system ATPase subunit